MQLQSLNGQWQLRHEALAAIGLVGLKVVNEMQRGWIPAAVPSEVHLDLMAAGLMKEPFFSTNTPACCWV